MDAILKMPLIVDSADVDLADCKSNAVANIVRGLRACSRTPAHHDSHESGPTWVLGEPKEFIVAVTIVDISVHE